MSCDAFYVDGNDVEDKPHRRMTVWEGMFGPPAPRYDFPYVPGRPGVVDNGEDLAPEPIRLQVGIFVTGATRPDNWSLIRDLMVFACPAGYPPVTLRKEIVFAEGMTAYEAEGRFIGGGDPVWSGKNARLVLEYLIPAGEWTEVVPP